MACQENSLMALCESRNKELCCKEHISDISLRTCNAKDPMAYILVCLCVDNCVAAACFIESASQGINHLFPVWSNFYVFCATLIIVTNLKENQNMKLTFNYIMTQ